MNRLLGFAALGGVLSLADAKALKWSPDDNEKRWTPAQPTLAFLPALGMYGLEGPEAPAPTSPPLLAARGLRGRSETDNTCGYVSGIKTNSMWCPTSSFCAYNSINSHIGCCDDASSTGCNVWTTCLKSADGSLFSTDNGLTLWCGFPDYPNCLTHIYADETATGYTLLGCGVAKGTDKIYITPFDETTTSTSRSRDATTTESEGTRTTSTRPALGPGSTDPPQPSQGGSSAPIGAIVGGVVGGVAAIALIAFGIFFLVRSNKKQKENIGPATAAAAPPPGPGPQGSPPPAGSPTPNMGQTGGYYDPSGAGFAHLDPRASIAKPPVQYGYDNGISPPSSPPPPSQGPGVMYNNTPSPPPQGYPQQYQDQQGGAYSPQNQYSPQQQQAMYSPQPGAYSPQSQQAPYPPPQQPQQPAQYQPYNPNQQYAVELPTQRGDGEVRELAA